MSVTFSEVLCQKMRELQTPKEKLLDFQQQWYPFPIVGCSDAEIDNLRQLQSVPRLPEIFREFLKCAGKASGDIFMGYDIGHQYMGPYDMKPHLNKLLAFDKQEPVKATDFAFMNLQGHSYWFFSTELNDPPVYLYILDSGEDDEDYPCKAGPVKVSDYLSEFLTTFIAKRESKAAQQTFLQTYAVSYQP